MSTSQRDHALMAAAALLSEFVEAGKPIQRKDARDVLGQLRKALAAPTPPAQQDAQAVPQGWRELLQQSKENCRYNHGHSSLADWIYASIEDLFARSIAAPTPPAQQDAQAVPRNPYAAQGSLANARLIAAAPELLDSLRVLLALHDADVFTADAWNASFEDARRAIHKALGEVL